MDEKIDGFDGEKLKEELCEWTFQLFSVRYEIITCASIIQKIILNLKFKILNLYRYIFIGKMLNCIHSVRTAFKTKELQAKVITLYFFGLHIGLHKQTLFFKK
jgi:hypothetical protein